MSDAGQGSPLRRDPHAVPSGRPAVEGVADDRVASRREVDADLVRAAGLWKKAQIRDAGQAREGFVARDSSLAVRPDLHLPSVPRIAAETFLDDATSRTRTAPNQGPIGLSNAARLKCLRKGAVGLEVLGEEHDSGGPDIQAVDEPELFLPWLPASLQQPRDRFSGRLSFAARRGHRDAGRLVQREDLLVLEQRHAGIIRQRREPPWIQSRSKK